MASFWLWIASIFFGLIGGGILILIFYGLFNLFRDAYTKRGIPKRKDRVSEYIRERPEKFNNTVPPKPSDKNKKEVEEDERRRDEKYREFEKLRRADIIRRKGKSKESISDTSGITELKGSGVLQTISNPGSKDSERRDTLPKRRLKLDD